MQMKRVGHRLSFTDNWQKLKFWVLFMQLSCCHGNGSDVTTSLKVLLNKKNCQDIHSLPTCSEMLPYNLPRFKRFMTFSNPFEPPSPGLMVSLH